MMIRFTATLCAALLAASYASAQDLAPDAESLRDAWPTQTRFSPYAGRNFPSSVYWGDTHLHTSLSFDAGAFGARLDPYDAYRFAKGR